jgi:hypothetical protein
MKELSAVILGIGIACWVLSLIIPRLPQQDQPPKPITVSNTSDALVSTLIHDNHKFIVAETQVGQGVSIIHHPDCSCLE